MSFVEVILIQKQLPNFIKYLQFRLVKLIILFKRQGIMYTQFLFFNFKYCRITIHTRFGNGYKVFEVLEQKFLPQFKRDSNKSSKNHDDGLKAKNAVWSLDQLN